MLQIPIFRDPFGPKVQTDPLVLPGTPMDTISDLSKSFDSNTSTSHASSQDRTKQINSSTESQNMAHEEQFAYHTIPNHRMRLASQIVETFKEHEKHAANTVPTNNPNSDNKSNESSQSNEQSRKNSDQQETEEKKGGRRRNRRNKSDESRRPSKQDAELLEDPDSLMFRDGRRKIDMILCYEDDDQGVVTEQDAKRREQRKTFQENLIKEGLEVEIEDKDQAYDEKTFFVKIHIPWRTESRYAEVMNMKLPIKRFITISVKAWENENRTNKPKDLIHKLWNLIKFIYKRIHIWMQYDNTLIEKEPSFHGATAGGAPEEQFIVKDRCTSYNSAQRSLLVMEILLRTKYDESEKVGIRRLLNDGTYLACFPLHEGRYDKPHNSGVNYDRRVS